MLYKAIAALFFTFLPLTQTPNFKGVKILGSIGSAKSTACGAIGSPCTDAFAGTTLSSNWTTISGILTVSGAKVSSTSDAQPNLAYYSAGTFGANQFSCFTLAAQDTNASVQIGPAVRVSADGTNFFWLEINGGFSLIQEMLSGTSQGAISSFFVTTQGHEYCLIASGTTITATDSAVPGVAGTVVATATSTDIPNGSPGLQEKQGGGFGTALSTFRGGSL